MAVQNAANIIMGPGTLYAGAQGVITAPPADTAVNTTPAASAWTDLGGTDGGIEFAVDPKFTDLTVDQIVDNIGDRLTSRTITVTTTLSEVTLANLAVALNTTVGATGSGFATLEPNYGAFASQTPYTSLILDGWAAVNGVATNARARIYLARAMQTGKIAPAYAKDKQVGFDVVFTAYYVSTSVAPFHITYQTT